MYNIFKKGEFFMSISVRAVCAFPFEQAKKALSIRGLSTGTFALACSPGIGMIFSSIAFFKAAAEIREGMEEIAASRVKNAMSDYAKTAVVSSLLTIAFLVSLAACGVLFSPAAVGLGAGVPSACLSIFGTGIYREHQREASQRQAEDPALPE